MNRVELDEKIAILETYGLLKIRKDLPWARGNLTVTLSGPDFHGKFVDVTVEGAVGMMYYYILDNMLVATESYIYQ